MNAATKYFDFHTHNRERLPDATYSAVLDCGCALPPDGFPQCAVGIHPWSVGADWARQLTQLEALLRLPHVCAVGECGLDRRRGGAWQDQLHCFEAQLRLARRYALPVVVHCVGAVDDVIRLCRGMRRVVFHGFRGKPEQARQLLRLGFGLSFGPRFHAESLREAWESGQMWLETDDSGVSIEAVYECAARALSISPTDIRVPGTLTE